MRYPEPYRRDGSPYFQFVYGDPRTGTRRRKSTGKDTKKEAREFIQKFIGDLSRTAANVPYMECDETQGEATILAVRVGKPSERSPTGARGLCESLTELLDKV